MPTIPLELPATLIFETVVTVGVSAWAWTLASASNQPPQRWAGLTCAGSFAVHRLCAWVVALTVDPNDVFATSGQIWRMVGPFLGTVLVFVGAPIVLGTLINPWTPPRRRLKPRPPLRPPPA